MLNLAPPVLQGECAEYKDMIMAVSGKDIAEFTRRLLSTKPSLAVFGENTDKVSYDALEELLQARGLVQQSGEEPVGCAIGQAAAAASSRGFTFSAWGV